MRHKWLFRAEECSNRNALKLFIPKENFCFAGVSVSEQNLRCPPRGDIYPSLKNKKAAKTKHRREDTKKNGNCCNLPGGTIDNLSVSIYNLYCSLT